jgi:hypothetical protein
VRNETRQPADAAKAREIEKTPEIEISATARASLKEGEDYYFDGPYMVFTERYHLKRGSCCGSGCRHCPYRDTVAAPGT